MSLVIAGRPIVVPGIDIVSWLDDRTLPKGTDFNPRKRKIRVIVWHTVHGRKGPLKPGIKQSTRDRVYAIYQARSPRNVSWHFTIDTDGSITQSLDPTLEVGWHASYTEVNEISLGIELVQDDDGSLYEGQLQVALQFGDVLHRELANAGHFVPKQIPWKNNAPDDRKLKRCLPPAYCANVCGAIGHRNNTYDKGFGDPGNHLFIAMQKHGYECFDIEAEQDLNTWKERQKILGLPKNLCDGTPGIKTYEAAKAAGFPQGICAL